VEIIYLPRFVKTYKKLSPNLQEEVRDKIELFRQDPGHPFLKIHKLHGILKKNHAFSVNYQYRIVFQYLSKEKVVLLCVGDHEIYK
jgi:mRNA-degrading endonuclease RelE of RelBE toxin-antitoxin system